MKSGRQGGKDHRQTRPAVTSSRGRGGERGAPRNDRVEIFPPFARSRMPIAIDEGEGGFRWGSRASRAKIVESLTPLAILSAGSTFHGSLRTRGSQLGYHTPDIFVSVRFTVSAETWALRVPIFPPRGKRDFRRNGSCLRGRKPNERNPGTRSDGNWRAHARGVPFCRLDV